jgi:WD40 repeat protein
MLAVLYNKQIGLVIFGGKIPAAYLKNPQQASPNILAFSHDGNMLAVGYTDGTTELWNIQNPAKPVTIGRSFMAPSAGNPAVSAVAFSPDGSLLATESGPTGAKSALMGTVRLWNIKNPADPELLPTTLTSTADLLAFRPVGLILATGNTDNSIQLWNVTDASHPHAVGAPLSGHTNFVFAMTFSTDGNVLATASADNSIRLWDVTDPNHPEAQAVLGRESSTATFFGITMAPNGFLAAPADTVLNGSTSARTWIWVTDRERDSKRICAKFATTPITRTQWQQYFPGQPYNPPCPAGRR